MAFVLFRGLRFVGRTGFEEASDPKWSSDSFGLDQCRWPWRGGVWDLERFQNTLRKFQAMSGFARMYLAGWGNDDDNVFPTVELSYIGIRKDIPPPKVEDGKSVQTVNSSITPTSGPYAGKSISLEATYRASRSSYSWIETTKPGNNPRFATVRNPVHPLQNILSWRVTDDKGSAGNLPLSVFVQLINSLSTRISVAEYRVEDIVPGAIWGCTSVVDYTLVGV